MSIPTVAFLDTSIFDGQQYNFSSTAFSTFAPACKARGVKLILPDPTEREIQRHIKEKSKQAVEALDAAIRKAPFLSKWRRFAQKAGPDWEVHQVARDEWAAFMKQFDVVRVGYQTLNIAEVMNWYDRSIAPFGQGKKRKEFPDAIAIALLDEYAQKNSCYIAVVAKDSDFEAACKRYSSLLYFDSLQGLTELLISTNDERVSSLQTAIQDDTDLLEDAVWDEALSLSYLHAEEGFFTLGDTDPQPVTVHNVRVVAIGNHEATVTFEANFVVKFELKWQEGDPYDDDPEHYSSTEEEDAMVTGSAKITFDESATKVTGVSHAALDQEEIELRVLPAGHWWNHR